MRHEDTTSSTVTQQDKEDAPEAQAACTAHCCSDGKGFQPVDKPTLDMIATFSLNGTSSSLG
jgi:hypothetical protein